jgi:hypothetical protein
LSYDELLSGLGDFSDLVRDDTALKFWLPESVERALEDLAKYYEVSVSMMVRMMMVEYVYGRYALAYMRENQLGIHRSQHPIMFSMREPEPDTKRVFKVPELGKNIAPVKVWIPQRLRDDLQVLAEHADVLLSRFVREIIIGAVLGRGTLPERPELRHFMVTQEAEAWERGEPVPMREEEGRWKVSELYDYEIETVYVDQSEGRSEIV